MTENSATISLLPILSSTKIGREKKELTIEEKREKQREANNKFREKKLREDPDYFTNYQRNKSKCRLCLLISNCGELMNQIDKDRVKCNRCDNYVHKEDNILYWDMTFGDPELKFTNPVDKLNFKLNEVYKTNSKIRLRTYLEIFDACSKPEEEK